MPLCMLIAALSGLLFGMMNLAHCAGMCGPLAAASCGGSSGRTAPLRYQLGRSVAYAYAGGLAGHFGDGLHIYAASWARWLFPLLTAAACLSAARGLLHSQRPERLFQVRSSRPGRRLSLARVLQLLPRDPLALGLLSVLLPCGLLFTALVAAVATGSSFTGASFMLGFAVSSGGALVSAGLLARVAATRSAAVKRGLACVLLVAAVLVVARPLAATSGNEASRAAHHSCH